MPFAHVDREGVNITEAVVARVRLQHILRRQGPDVGAGERRADHLRSVRHCHCASMGGFAIAAALVHWIDASYLSRGPAPLR